MKRKEEYIGRKGDEYWDERAVCGGGRTGEFEGRDGQIWGERETCVGEGRTSRVLERRVWG